MYIVHTYVLMILYCIPNRTSLWPIFRLFFRGIHIFPMKYNLHVCDCAVHLYSTNLYFNKLVQFVELIKISHVCLVTSWLSRTETFTIKIVDGRLAVLINPISVHYIQILRKLQQPKKQNKMVKKNLLQIPKKCFMKSIVTFHPVSLLNYLQKCLYTFRQPKCVHLGHLFTLLLGG